MFLINFSYELKKWRLKYFEKKLKQIANYVFAYKKLSDDIIFECHFVNLDTIHELNLKYRNKNMPTDVISFALWDNGIKTNLLGELYICYDKIIEQKKRFHHSFKREICFLFLHGLLHLLGYDHLNKEDENIMFGLQEEVLTKLGVLRHVKR